MKKGWTAVESLIAVTMLAILMAIVTPQFKEQPNKATTQPTTKENVWPGWEKDRLSNNCYKVYGGETMENLIKAHPHWTVLSINTVAGSSWVYVFVDPATMKPKNELEQITKDSVDAIRLKEEEEEESTNGMVKPG